MNFTIKKKNPIIEDQKKSIDKKDLDIAYEFSKVIIKEFQDFIKAIILFGSVSRKDKTSGDIDILIILDDVQIQFNRPIIQGYRVLVEKIIEKVSPKIHVTNMRLTNFWEYIKISDPIAINILRDGIPIIDTGVFTPLKLLLYQGKIKPSKESIYNYINRSEHSIISSKNHILAACVDLYWAVIDSAEAALMKAGDVPPGPSHVHNLIEEKFVKTGKVEKKYSMMLHEFYHLNKAIEHKEITYIPAQQYQEYLHKAEDFIKCMQ